MGMLGEGFLRPFEDAWARLQSFEGELVDISYHYFNVMLKFLCEGCLI